MVVAARLSAPRAKRMERIRIRKKVDIGHRGNLMSLQEPKNWFYRTYVYWLSIGHKIFILRREGATTRLYINLYAINTFSFSCDLVHLTRKKLRQLTRTRLTGLMPWPWSGGGGRRGRYNDEVPGVYLQIVQFIFKQLHHLHRQAQLFNFTLQQNFEGELPLL